MAKKSFFDGILGKNKSAPVMAERPVQAADAGAPVPDNPTSENPAQEQNGEAIEHLYITEDNKKNKKHKKKTVQKDPKIDTAILRNRIADKIAKMNNG